MVLAGSILSLEFQARIKTDERVAFQQFFDRSESITQRRYRRRQLEQGQGDDHEG